jgi:hypothetical protein
MARKSVQKGEDDNAKLAKELLAATAQSRRPSAEMVERVRAAGRPAATSTPLPSSEPSERTSGVVARTEAAAAATAATPAPSKTHPGVIIGIVGGALALAACVALFLKSAQPETPTSAALAAEKAADAPVAAAKVAPPAPAANPANDGVVSPEAMAAAPQAVAPGAAKAGGAKAVLGGAAAPAPALGAKAASAPGAAAKPDAVVLEDDPEPPKARAAAPKAEAAPEPPLKPAEGSASSVPLNPSGGAVSTALGSVRGSAQACLAGQTEPVTAVVTFGADGHVLRVSAAGPSGPCIQAALSKAHIAPFAKESFTASTTIRPP